MPSKPSKIIETFESPNPGSDYSIRIDIPEFTCLCPLTGQPDFAKIKIAYVPDRKCIELKSLKMYMWSFREEGAFHEKVTNDMLAAFVAACEPRFMRVTGEFNVRGGIYTTVIAEHKNESWQAPALIQLP